MNKSSLTLLTVTAVGPGEVPYSVNVAAGEQWVTDKVCKCLNDFMSKKWTPIDTTVGALLMDKSNKKELLDDLSQISTAAQAKRIMKALEHVVINHRVDLEEFIFSTDALTAI